MRRREFLAFLTGLTTWPFAAHAEQPAIPIVGFLSSLSAAALVGPIAAFRNGLQSAGYTEGKNVEIDFRWADGHYDRLPALAADLVSRRAAVIVTVGGDPPASAAKASSTTIPIVFMVGRDPVELGLVKSLNRPGGNATGINLQVAELESKRIELMRQLAPTGRNLAVLVNPKNADANVQIKAVQLAAHTLNEQIKIYNVSNEVELANAFTAFRKDDIKGFILVADPFFVNRRDQIISSAAQGRVAGVYFLREFAESGGLASYGSDLAEAYRQAGIYAGKILGGTKPDNLPVVQPTKFDLVINLKTARALGFTVPASLLAIADQVIE
ncbi:MAG TPA: ABC transporter substrate-binding protein [Pseudolabrys sp.]|nr:ABC transporter substrate-binding protein [Pseudolabrys sp.]